MQKKCPVVHVAVKIYLEWNQHTFHYVLKSTFNIVHIGKTKTSIQMIAILFLLYHQPLLVFSQDDILNAGLILLLTATILTLWSGFNYLIAGLKTFDS